MSLSREMILSRVRWSIDAERVSVALLRLGLVLRGYDPNQPRVPAGSSEGGQWTDGGEGGSYPSEDGAWITLVSDNDDRRLSVDLGEEEARGGHTLRKHLGRTDDEMRERVQRSAWWTMPGRGGLRRNGTFASQDAATNLINQTLRKNAEIVNEVASGKRASDF